MQVSLVLAAVQVTPGPLLGVVVERQSPRTLGERFWDMTTPPCLTWKHSEFPRWRKGACQSHPIDDGREIFSFDDFTFVYLQAGSLVLWQIGLRVGAGRPSLHISICTG